MSSASQLLFSGIQGRITNISAIPDYDVLINESYNATVFLTPATDGTMTNFGSLNIGSVTDGAINLATADGILGQQAPVQWGNGTTTIQLQGFFPNTDWTITGLVYVTSQDFGHLFGVNDGSGNTQWAGYYTEFNGGSGGPGRIWTADQYGSGLSATPGPLGTWYLSTLTKVGTSLVYYRDEVATVSRTVSDVGQPNDFTFLTINQEPDASPPAFPVGENFLGYLAILDQGLTAEEVETLTISTKSTLGL